MTKAMYLRGLIAQPWYNFTESIAYAITGRPIPENIVYQKKLPYGKDKLQYINTFHRKDLEKKKKPLLIYIHGGSWISGITEMRNAYILNWAQKGFFTCSISYSYAPQKIFPFQLQEVFSAIDMIFDNSELWGIDTDNIVIAGESAGGYFINHVAACVKDKTALDSLGIVFRHHEQFSLKALVSHCGAFSLERLSDSTKPQSKFPDMKMMLVTYTGKKLPQLREYFKTDEGKLIDPKTNSGFPPCFLAVASRDPLRHETKDFIKELCNFHVPYKYFVGDGSIGNHAWTIVTMLKKGKKCLEETFDYVLPYLPDCFIKKGGQWQIKE